MQMRLCVIPVNDRAFAPSLHKSAPWFTLLLRANDLRAFEANFVFINQDAANHLVLRLTML
jgi:hypothetical protein